MVISSKNLTEKLVPFFVVNNLKQIMHKAIMKYLTTIIEYIEEFEQFGFTQEEVREYFQEEDSYEDSILYR